MTDMTADSRKQAAEEMAIRVLGGAPESMENPLTVLASPAWRGVEADVWRARRGDSSTILKHYHIDVQDYVDVPAAIGAAFEAGRLGVGPTIKGFWHEAGLLAMEDLHGGWVAGGLHHATRKPIRERVIAAKKQFQGGAELSTTRNVFDEIEQLHEKARALGATLHVDCEVFIDYFKDARHKIDSRGFDEVPCHRDGNTANLMVHDKGDVMLIDFDLAGKCDPFEDIGCYLAEFFESDADARPGFEEWHGHFDEGLFQRARIYGLADDLRWGLIGALMAKTSPRNSLEFGKYASWRFLRLEMHLKRSDANDRIRLAK